MSKRDLPFMPFYTVDWMTDEQVQSCSLAARGLWIQMLCLMWRSDSRGKLLVNGRPPSVQQLSRLVSEDADAVGQALDELRAAGVFDECDGVITSRRMVRDEDVRESARDRKRKERAKAKAPPGDVTPLSQERHSGVTSHSSEDRVQKEETASAVSRPEPQEAAAGPDAPTAAQGLPAAEEQNGKRGDDPEPDDPRLLDFPIKGRGGPVWWLTRSRIDRLAEEFPGIDILAEARKARGWCIDNPANRKTVKGMPKFLRGWIERSNNRGTAAGQTRISHDHRRPTYADQRAQREYQSNERNPLRIA